MDGTLLIDAVVRQTTVLLAALSTATGNRASLAHVANEVFGSLVNELKAQGVTSKVIADMFGMALRTYQDRVARISESQSERGRTLWDAVLAYLKDSGPARRSDVLRRFSRDSEATVRSVLRDLVASGLASRSGRDDFTVYRATSIEEQGLADATPGTDADAQLVLVAVYHHGPISRDDLGKLVPMPASEADALLERLVREGRLTKQERDGELLFARERLLIPYGDESGWQAAVFDHYQAVVAAISAKLRAGHTRAAADEAVGGSTYHLDIWDGHPFEQQALGLLASLRGQATALRTSIEDHNTSHPRPAEARPKRVIAYMGQNVLAEETEHDD